MAIGPDQPCTTESFLAGKDREEFRHEFDGLRVIPMTGGSLAHQDVVFNLRTLPARLPRDLPFPPYMGCGCGLALPCVIRR